MSDFTFLEQIYQPAIVLSSSYEILYANQYAKNRFLTMANLNLEIGKHFLSIFEESEFKVFGKQLVQLLDDFQRRRINEHNYRFHVENLISMQVCFRKNYQEDIGDYWVITAVNITKPLKEEQNIQKRYQEQLDVFKILFDMAPVGIGIKDFEGGFYKVNQGLVDMSGYSKIELMELPQEKIFPAYNIEKESELIKAMIESKHRSFRRESILITKTGDTRIVLETINIVRDENNEPFIVIVSYQDITEEKELQKLLIESRKMEELGKLAGGIAHDFNNMLLPVTLCSDIALQELSQMDLVHQPNLIKIQNYIQKISVSAQKAKTLIQKLFQYSQTGKYDTVVLDLREEIEKAMELIYLQKPPNIDIHLNIEEGDYKIMGESIWIEQILDNLVINAFHSMKFKPQGNVYVRLHQKGNKAILMVEDEGYGIEDKDLEKIFQPFYTKKNEKEGTGIGLTIVKAMVEKMNGNITVTSHVGKGTNFQIVFPLQN